MSPRPVSPEYFDLNQTDGVRHVVSAMMSSGDPVGITPTTEGQFPVGYCQVQALDIGVVVGATQCFDFPSA